MARKIFVQSGGGGGGSVEGLITQLPLISTASWSGSYTLAQSYSGGCQLNANQFGYVEFGASNASNIIALQARPIQVSESGSITIGAESTATNSSGTSISTTLFASEPAPGRYAIIGRQYWSGSTYYINSYGATFASNNTVSTGVSQGNDYNTGASYAHPNSGNLIGAGNGSALFVPGYNSNSYGTWNRYDYNGSSNYSYSTGSTVNTYSSTHYGFPALQHWSDTQSRCGILSDHRNAASGFYMSEVTDATSNPTALGYSNNLLGSTDYSSVTGYRLSNGKAVYVNSPGNYLVTNGAGTVLRSAAALARPNLSTNYPYVNLATTALGGDYFGQVASGGNWVIFKVATDASNYATIEPVGTLLGSAGLSPNPTTSYTTWRLGGAQKQNLVVMSPGVVSVYDATALTSLMV